MQKSLIIACLFLPITTLADEPDNSGAYRRAAGSVVLIHAIDREWNVSSGTGVVVDAQKGHILTAFHVVGTDRLVMAGLANRDQDGGIITDPRHYTDPKKLDPCIVVSRDESRDLALIRWKTPHQGLTAIPMAAKSATPGESVFCIGNGEGMRFRYTGGSVRSVGREDYTADGHHVTARIANTSCPIGPGDSGGPLISRDGQLLGVMVASATNLNQVYKAIDVSEIRSFLSIRGTRNEK